MRRAFRRFRLALSFLTIIPVPFSDGVVEESDLAGWLPFAPAIGILIGGILAGTNLVLAHWEVAQGVAAVVLVAAWAAITGGLHLDGLADTADGLFLRGGPDRRLEVMRDPHLGSFGTSALILVLLGKYAVLSSLDFRGRMLALFGSVIVGRALLLVTAGAASYARPDGKGRAVVAGSTPILAIGGGVFAIGAGGLIDGRFGASGSLAALGMIGLLTWAAVRRLGGITGDILGASVELGELVYLLVVGGAMRP